MLLKRVYIVFGFVAFGAGGALAQGTGNTCEATLKNAQSLYDEGLVEQVADTLIPCIDELSVEDRIAALKLIINSYLYEDKTSLAEDYMVVFLKTKPDYVPTPGDTKEFKELYQSFNTSAFFTFGGYFGLNISRINPINTFGVQNTNTTAAPVYNSRLGFQFGARGNLYLFKNMYLSVEAEYAQLAFDYNAQLFDFSDLTFTEKQDHLTSRLNLEYYFGKPMAKFRPSLKLGGVGTLLAGADAEFVRSYPNGEHGSVSGSEESVSSTKRPLMGWLMGGVGFTYRIGKHYLYLDARYNMGLHNVINNEARFTIPEVVHKYYYVDDDYSMDYINVLVGFNYALYNPKKKKKK